MSTTQPILPYDVLAGLAGTLGDLPFVLAPPPSGGDDAPAIQALMTANYPRGINVGLRKGAYLIYTELTTAGLPPGRLFGPSHNYGDAYSAELRAMTPGMRSVFAATSYRQQVERINLNGNRMALNVVYAAASSQLSLKDNWIHDALVHGVYFEAVDNNQNCHLQTNNIEANGTTYVTAGIAAQYTNGHKTTITGTASMTAGNPTITIVGSSTDLTTIHIHPGSFIRIGSTISLANVQAGTLFFGQILSVTANTITLYGAGRNLPRATLAGQEFAIGVGDGVHESQYAGNGYTLIDGGGSVRSNGNCGVAVFSLYGDTIAHTNVDFANFFSFEIGLAAFDGDTEQTIVDHCYIEGNILGDYWIGSTRDVEIRAPTFNTSPLLYYNIAEFGYSGLLTRLGQVWHIDYGAPQKFVLQIRNNAGTIEHRIVSDWISGGGGGVGVGAEIDRISNVTGAYTATPTVDGVTPFAAGVGVLSSSKEILLFDNAHEQNSSGGGTIKGSCFVEGNTTGTAYTVVPAVVTTNVNGQSFARMTLRLINAAGNQVQWTTANIPVGTFLAIRVVDVMMK